MRKTPEGTFLEEGKEPVIARIFKLVDRYPSRSEAARAWGINVGTLNNYYKRKHLNPTPRRSQLIKIAEKENVSIEWLTSGEGSSPDMTPTEKDQKRPIDGFEHSHDDIDSKLSMLLSLLRPQEKKALFDVLGRKGAEFSLILLDDDIAELHALEGVRRSLALSLKNFPEEKVREIYEECEAKGNHFNVNEKQASA
ncbi:TPA: bacteriophage CI repressor [Salmonella enterica]|nr:bacteriophage CI repressor [Salmonella enterica]